MRFKVIDLNGFLGIEYVSGELMGKRVYVYRCLEHEKDILKPKGQGLIPSRSGLHGQQDIVDILCPWIPVLDSDWDQNPNGLGKFDSETRSYIRGNTQRDNTMQLRYNKRQMYTFLGETSLQDHTILNTWEKFALHGASLIDLDALSNKKLGYPPVNVGP